MRNQHSGLSPLIDIGGDWATGARLRAALLIEFRPLSARQFNYPMID